MDARAVPPAPTNEPIRWYAPGDPARESLTTRIEELAKETLEAPCVIGGRPVPTGETFEVRAPHRRDLRLATVHGARQQTVEAAVDAARAAQHDWAATDWQERAAIFLRAAELLADPWRDTLNAATMLGQSKTVHQAEIDAACELIDFFRFNVHFYAELLADQPTSTRTDWNRLDLRPLDGFVLAMTPFNFTSIAGNLPTAPALCGNTVVWKPSEKQAYSAHFLMQLLEQAGLPDGVINLVHGDGALTADVCFSQPDFAGLHFTGSHTVFQGLWRAIGERVASHRQFPRVVGETGGKDFVVAHSSADLEALVVGLVRGAFEYQGQKCSAASRAYVPRDHWPELRDRLADVTGSLVMGDVSDFRTFLGAVIDERKHHELTEALALARQDADLEILAGGGTDDTDGWFVEPTILVTVDPHHRLMETELFGPILTVYVYDPAEWDATLDLVDTTSPYALTGAVFATDREAITTAARRLRHAAGNFYVNDKPTGAVVGQQPFGGSRASGTNDKAGSRANLLRWVSQRTIKENLVPPTEHTYPSMQA